MTLPNWVPNCKLEAVLDFFAKSPFIYTAEQITDIHASLQSRDHKHFIVLAGISGTGKSSFAKLYCDALYAEQLNCYDGSADNPYFVMVPVKPDWLDSSHLLGYHNVVSDRWVMESLLQTIQDALAQPKSIFVFCLDEMNLARVEYYLAEVLSAVESKQPIKLHNDAKLESNGYPREVSFPKNLYIIGTVNVDDTIKQFSDKVLDRVDIIDLSEMDLPDLKKKLNEKYVTVLDNATFESVFSVLSEIHTILSKVHMQFGYRTFHEAFDYISYIVKEVKSFSLNEAIDKVILQKVLPKLRGDERHTEMLAALSLTLASYKRSSEKIGRLQEQLELGGFHYWN